MAKLFLFLLFITLAAFLIDFADSSPTNYLTRDKEDMIGRYVELVNDKSHRSFLRDPQWDVNSFLIRNKRQAESLDDVSGSVGDSLMEDRSSQAGFFDRAARFVMDLLQRFLKWINAGEN